MTSTNCWFICFSFRNNQYFFKCDCYACSKNWPLYPSLPTSVVPLATSTVEQKVVMNEFHKMTKQYRKAFDSVLQGHYEDAIPILKEYLSYLDNNVKRPIRDYNDCQEALKQCWSALANAFAKTSSLTSTTSASGGRKESAKEMNSTAWKLLFFKWKKRWNLKVSLALCGFVFCFLLSNICSFIWSVHKFLGRQKRKLTFDNKKEFTQLIIRFLGVYLQGKFERGVGLVSWFFN